MYVKPSEKPTVEEIISNKQQTRGKGPAADHNSQNSHTIYFLLVFLQVKVFTEGAKKDLPAQYSLVFTKRNVDNCFLLNKLTVVFPLKPH